MNEQLTNIFGYCVHVGGEDPNLEKPRTEIEAECLNIIFQLASSN